MKNLAIVRSDDAPTNISPEDLSAYTERVMMRMRQLGNSVPPILVVHVSESVAAAVGVGCTGIIRHNRSAVADLSSYYEIWLVGRAAFADYVIALQGIVEDFNSASILASGMPA